jgi:hypothetical protein
LRGKIPPFAIPDSVTVMTAEEFDKTKTATGKGESPRPKSFREHLLTVRSAAL